MKPLLAALLVSGSALAQHSHHAPSESAFGRPGDPAKVSRTIEVDMSDKLRFTPSVIEVKQGETIRLRAKNSGQTLHEMVLGTKADLKKHAEDMRKKPGMKHDAPYLTHVAPGKTGSIVWQFTKAGEFEFACLVPGHFEGGMIGQIKVSGKNAALSREQIAPIEAEYRLSHPETHRRMRALLTEEQVAQYDRLRR